jgi:isoleucyl-tRNA synthetase
LIFALSLLPELQRVAQLPEGRVIAEIHGSKFEHRKARHPFIERDSLLILADYVTLDQGTGAVHTAPGHGADDYYSGIKYGLEILNPVDGRGRFYQDPSTSAGFVFDANPKLSSY